MYINPIPYIDEAKKFEMRLSVSLDNVTEVSKAKEIVAEYILGLSKEDIVKSLSCKMYPVYPKEGSESEQKEYEA